MHKIEKKTNSEFVDFERSFLMKTSLVAVLISLIGLFINIALGFGIVLYIIPIIAMIVYALFYFSARITKSITLIKWLFVIVTFIFLNLLWLYNYGSYGPAPYFFILIYSLLIFIFSKKQLSIISVILIINILVFFFLDIYFPELTNNYNNDLARIVDVYTGLIFYSLIVFVLINNAKVNFTKEYHKAKVSDNLKTNFLQNISHEIRTPLNAILGFSSLMGMDNIENSDKEEYIRAIDKSNQSLLKLVNQIIDASQIQAESISLDPQEIDIRTIMDSIYAKHKALLLKEDKSHIDFLLNLPENDGFINIDKERFEQVFSILLDNAIKFTENGRIELGCKIRKTDYLFWVTDTGIGIKGEFQDHIFTFFQKHEENKSGLYRGTGIGLFIAKSLIDLNRGKIWVKSEYGKGTSIYFSLNKPVKHILRQFFKQ